MLQGDRVLVAHGLQMARHDTADGFHFGFPEPKARSPCTSSGSTTSSWGCAGSRRSAGCALPRSPTVPGEPGARVGSRFRRPAYSSTMICRVRTGRREQVELLQPPVAVGQEVDGGRQAGHREAGVSKGFCIWDLQNDETRQRRVLGSETERWISLLSRARTPRSASCLMAATLCAVLMPVGQINAPRATMAWRAIRIASSRSISVASTSLPSTPTAVSVPSEALGSRALSLAVGRFAAHHGTQRQVLRGRDGVPGHASRDSALRTSTGRRDSWVERQWAWLTLWR